MRHSHNCRRSLRKLIFCMPADIFISRLNLWTLHHAKRKPLKHQCNIPVYQLVLISYHNINACNYSPFFDFAHVVAYFYTNIHIFHPLPQILTVCKRLCSSFLFIKLKNICLTPFSQILLISLNQRAQHENEQVQRHFETHKN